VDRVEVLVNGQSQEVAEGTTVAQLLAERGMLASHVAVEVNLQLVPRDTHAQRVLQEGDRLEVVTLVGGG
jgi:sulfur carrier protein